MATNTAGSAAQEYHTRQIHYLHKQIGETAAGASGTLGIIPAGSVILLPISGVQIHTAFSGTAPTVDIGTSDNADAFGSALDLDAAIGFVPLDEAAGLRVAVDTTVTYAITLDTPVAADGDAEIVIAYIPNLG